MVFIFRLAWRAVCVRRAQFLALTLTLTAACTLLVSLGALYFNARSQLAQTVSGVPNMKIQPQKGLLRTTKLSMSDVRELRSDKFFWRNNVLSAMPVVKATATHNDQPVQLAGTWFKREVTVDGESSELGLLTFGGWEYSGHFPKNNQVILGANLPQTSMIRLKMGQGTYLFPVAGVLKSGSYWDNYVFMDAGELQRLTGPHALDEILVSAVIKPKDELAAKADRLGEQSLTMQEFEKWSCSPYAASVAYSIKQVLPQGEVRLLRRITDVQEGLVQSWQSLFLPVFALILIASITAVFSAEKMYISSHLKDHSVMQALGGSSARIFVPIILEMALAAILSGILVLGASSILLNAISKYVFAFPFEVEGTLIVLSALIPFVAITPALFVYRGFSRKTDAQLRED